MSLSKATYVVWYNFCEDQPSFSGYVIIDVAKYFILHFEESLKNVLDPNPERDELKNLISFFPDWYLVCLKFGEDCFWIVTYRAQTDKQTDR